MKDNNREFGNRGGDIEMKMDEKVKKSALDIIEVSKELLEKSDITVNEIEMSLALLSEAKTLLCFVEHHLFK